MLGKERIYEILEVAAPGDKTSRVFDLGIMAMIAINAVALIAETVDSIFRVAPWAFRWFEIASVLIFTAEYLLRVWSCTVNPTFQRPVRGRLRFAVTPLALVDLCAVLPFYLPLLGLDLRFLRVLRLFRWFRLAKVGRYSRALQTFGRVLTAKKEELVITVFLILILLVLASSSMYYAEHEAQPEAFSSIPAAMWWGVATLTTVGYGDVYPVTALGKVMASILAVLGIGMFALPTGILGAAFVEEIKRTRSSELPMPQNQTTTKKIQQLRACVEMLEFYEKPLLKSLELGGQQDDPPAIIFRRAFAFGRTSVKAMIAVAEHEQDCGVCAPTICRPFYELAVRTLWASREQDGWKQLLVYWQAQRKVWAEEAVKAPDLADHAKSVLKNATNYLKEVDPTGQIQKRFPGMKRLLREIEKSDLNAGIKEKDYGSAAFEYTSLWRSMCRTAHAHITSVASPSTAHLHIGTMGAVCATFALLRAMMVITAPDSHALEEGIDTVGHQMIRILKGDMDLGLEEVRFTFSPGRGTA